MGLVSSTCVLRVIVITNYTKNLSICTCNNVIVWLAVVFGINSVSNAGRKIVIVQGTAEHYYNFHTCIASTIN